MSSNQTSNTLLMKAQQGEEDAWTDLYNLYSPFVYCWVSDAGIKGGDIEQIHANVFSKIYMGLIRFEHNGRVGAFRKWIRTTTRNEVIEFRRKNIGVSLKEDIEEMDDYEISEERSILYHRAWEIARSEFSPRDQLIFEKVVECEEAPKDVASNFELTVSNVYRIVSEIKSHIRDRFKGELF